MKVIDNNTAEAMFKQELNSTKHKWIEEYAGGHILYAVDPIRYEMGGIDDVELDRTKHQWIAGYNGAQILKEIDPRGYQEKLALYIDKLKRSNIVSDVSHE